jgi:uncharacterized short protein YbdD (DUF466 family)
MNDIDDGYEDYLKTIEKHGLKPLMTREQFRQSFKEKSREKLEDESHAQLRNPQSKVKGG